MRNSVLIAFFLVIAGGICGANSAYALNLPKRQAGLWKIEMTGAKAPKGTVFHCVDDATDQKMRAMAEGIGNAQCSKNETTQDGTGYHVKSVCSMAGSTITSTSNFSGDFVNSYHADISTSYEPPLIGMKESSISMDAKYMGACTTQKPGDIVMPNGMTINVLTMGKGPSPVGGASPIGGARY